MAAQSPPNFVSNPLGSGMEGLSIPDGELPDLENLLEGYDDEQDPEWFNSLLNNALDVDLDFSVPLEDLLSPAAAPLPSLSFSDQTLSNAQSSEGSVIANAESHEISYQISSPACSSGDSTVDDARKNLKRKSDDGGGDLQNGVFGCGAKNPSSPTSFMDDDEKRKTRLMRNRESAQLSRQRRKNYMDELEDKVKSMNSTIAELNNTIACLSAENIKLKQQLGMGALYQNPNPNSNPNQPSVAMPFPYSWPSFPAYPVLPGPRVYGPGSQAPLVPIPRLKSQPAAVSKGRKPSKQSAETEQKPGKRVKKVASVAFVGIFFFIFFFLGGILPVPDMTLKQSRDLFAISSGELSSGNGGRVLASWDGNNSTLGSKFKPGFDKEGFREKEAFRNHVYPQNGSVPLVASLFVPRNDKLVKIDGNLIIHAVLAGEKASRANRDGREDISSMKKESEKNSLAIITERHRALAAARASGRNVNIQSHLLEGVADSQRALASNSRSDYRENAKPTSADKSLRQWFREGLAGPVLSSGMCTEVFQFDASPNSPATTRSSKIVTTVSPRVANSSVGQLKNNSSHSQITEARRLGSINALRNRRVSYAVPLPPARPPLKDRNFTDHTERIQEDKGYDGENTTSSSMVVSVLVDPRETGDEGMFSSGSLSRIFVVVLIDRVKYVTYSCVLPTKNSVPHLVRS